MTDPLPGTHPVHSRRSGEGEIGGFLSMPLLDISVAVVLGFALCTVFAIDRMVLRDVAQAPLVDVPLVPPDSEPEPPPPEPPVIEPPADLLTSIDPVRRVKLLYGDDMRFGISTTTGNPDDSRDDDKKLTYSADGATNNTRLWVDGSSPMLGSDSGRTIRPMRDVSDDRIESEWEFRSVRVRQSLTYVAGEMSRRVDSVQVGYRLENTGSSERQVGLRVMLDSLIGDNDGVPFIVPGREGIVTGPQVFSGESIPHFVRALEIPNLVNPGVIADLSIKFETSERPSKVVLTHWPGPEASWEYDATVPFGNDTAIGLYYDPQPLAPGGERVLGFVYGLGTISSTRSKNARLSLTAGGPFRPGGKFWLVALVQNPKHDQRVHLELPQGLSLDAAHSASKPVVAGAAYAQVSWLVQIASDKLGTVEIKAILDPDRIEERQQLTIEPRDARLTLVAQGPVSAGKPFWVSALVRDAKPGQTLELRVSEQMSLSEGESLSKPVPQKERYGQVNWLVRTAPRVARDVQISVRLHPDGIEEKIIVLVQAGTLID